MKTVKNLERYMTEPSQELIEDIKRLDGDILILGVGGKMGPTMAKMIKRAIDQADVEKRVMGASRFTDEELRNSLESFGIETYAVDLLEDASLDELPDIKNILYMVGTKFGTKGKEHYTWIMNAYLPGRIAERYKDSRIVAFSSGNVYPLTTVTSTNCSEDMPVNPIGEYAQSCLGRERVLTNLSIKNKTPMVILRLNYAIDLRYGVLLEVAQDVEQNRRIDLSMGVVNVIWQGDANEYAIRSFLHCENPPKVLNVTGPETISVRWLAHEFGKRLGKQPKFMNEEKSTALLNHAGQAHQLFGYPHVSLQEMIDLTVSWVENKGVISNKPTHFQERGGEF